MKKEEIEKLVLQEIVKTENKIEKYEEMTAPVAPDNAYGRVSRMDAIHNKSLTEMVLRQSKEKLVMLKHVLTQIDSPDFGKCIKCNAEIPIQRIIVKPESMLCVNCAR
ncbi:MAG: TraR/DksA family transcriptional regulator [Marinilabiliales bacterium]|nr:MAG: TraR/DksA family transcriptional regulator [Marinilabiliales bacterium]